jgi:hypothetical protein
MASPIQQAFDDMAPYLQNNLREELAEEMETIFKEFGDVEGFTGIAAAGDADVCRDIINRMTCTFVAYVWEQRGVFFRTQTPDFDRYDLGNFASTWFGQVLDLDVLPKEAAPSGSYPDSLYHFHVILFTLFGEKDERNASDEEVKHENESGDEAERSDVGAGAGYGGKKRPAAASSTATPGKQRKVTPAIPSTGGGSSSTPGSSNRVDALEMANQRWDWRKKPGIQVRCLFYQQLAKMCEAGAQFSWGLVEEALSMAVGLYNSMDGILTPCPSDAHAITTTAAGTARSTWLGSKNMKQKDDRKNMKLSFGSEAGQSSAVAARREADDCAARQLAQIAEQLAKGMQNGSAKMARALVIRSAKSVEEANELLALLDAE